MTSNQEQHEINTTVEELHKRQQQVRKAIDRGYFSSTAEGQQLSRDIFMPLSKLKKLRIPLIPCILKRIPYKSNIIQLIQPVLRQKVMIDLFIANSLLNNPITKSWIFLTSAGNKSKAIYVGVLDQFSISLVPIVSNIRNQ